jgi:hypothetical protein
MTTRAEREAELARVATLALERYEALRAARPPASLAFADLPLTAMLTPTQCAEWLQVSKSTFYRLGIPKLHTGRYNVGQVLEHLKRKAR